ncbi:MAG TPA: FkbM family methyltransferase [Isosphaeraceae bacterium]
MIKDFARGVLPAWAWARLRGLRARHQRARYRPRRVRHIYGGAPLEILLADPLAEGWYDADWPEPPEFALLKRHRLGPGARVFDLGAHQGVVALMLARIAGPEGFVLAVEANRHNAEVARINRDLNDCPTLHVLHAAVAEAPGTVTFNQGLNGQVDDGTGAWGRVEVPAVSIDDLARTHGPPDVLFLDVEGFECQALRGARETLARRPDCYIEVHVGVGLEALGGSVREVLSFFPEAAYERFIASDAAPAFAPLQPDSGAMRGRFFLVAMARG